MGAGAGLSAEGCLETSFPIPPPGDASIAAITNPGSGIDPQVLADQISAASTQTGVNAESLNAAIGLLTSFSLDTDPTKVATAAQNAASAIPLPGNLGDIIADPVAHIPTDLSAATPSCEGDYGPLSALIDSICIEAAAAPDLGQIIQDINGIVEGLQAQVSTLEDRVSNVQHVVGTERPVDGTGNNNGAQPISYWSYNSWARDIQHSTALNSLDGKVSNLQHVVGTERPVDGTGNNNGAQPLSYWSYSSWARDVLNSGALSGLDDRVTGLFGSLGGLDDKINGVSGSLSTLDEKASNIQHVLGTERAVDGTGNNNGAQPITYWAYNGWARGVLNSTTLTGLESKVNDIKGPFGDGESYSFHSWDNSGRIKTLVEGPDGKSWAEHTWENLNTVRGIVDDILGFVN
jgi:hypothetical protein